MGLFCTTYDIRCYRGLVAIRIDALACFKVAQAKYTHLSACHYTVSTISLIATLEGYDPFPVSENFVVLQKSFSVLSMSNHSVHPVSLFYIYEEPVIRCSITGMRSDSILRSLEPIQLRFAQLEPVSPFIRCGSSTFSSHLVALLWVCDLILNVQYVSILPIQAIQVNIRLLPEAVPFPAVTFHWYPLGPLGLVRHPRYKSV